MSIIDPSHRTFKQQLSDIKSFLSQGELDLTDFFEGSEGDLLARSITSVYESLDSKLETYRREQVISSASRDISIKSIASGHLNYNYRQRVAPQQSGSRSLIFTCDSSIPISFKTQLGTIKLDNQVYPLSIVNMISSSTSGPDTTYEVQVGIGQWKTRQIDLTSDDRSEFKYYHVTEDRDVIDDSGTLKISTIVNGTQVHRKVITRSMHELVFLNETQNANAVYVKNHIFGGLMINFGDGALFGSGTENANWELEVGGNCLKRSGATTIVVDYFVTPGKVSSLKLNWNETRTIVTNVSFFPNLVKSYIKFDEIYNGSESESLESIKLKAPIVNVAGGKILNDMDLISEFSRLPGVKSCHSTKDVTVADNQWISTNTYKVGSIVAYNTHNYVAIKDCGVKDVPGTSSYWVEIYDKLYRNNATLKLWAILDESPPRSMNVSEWFQRYYKRYNLDQKLGFLTVKVEQPTVVNKKFSGVGVLKPFSNPNNVDLNAITSVITEIVRMREYVLGVSYNIGDILNEILKIDGLDKFYISEGNANEQLHPSQYYQFTFDIKVNPSDSTSNLFGGI